MAVDGSERLGNCANRQWITSDQLGSERMDDHRFDIEGGFRGVEEKWRCFTPSDDTAVGRDADNHMLLGRKLTAPDDKWHAKGNKHPVDVDAGDAHLMTNPSCYRTAWTDSW